MSLVAMPDPTAAHGDALERLLGDLAVSVRSQPRIEASVDEVIALDPDAVSVVYVTAGTVRLPSGGAHPESLAAGDALLVSGGPALALRIQAGSEVLVSRLILTRQAGHVRALLPDVAWIHRFVELEPAAAALAGHLGGNPDDDCPLRDGDLVICRMMATTLLQSVIRAWTTIGCAPLGWPSRTGDLFLDRVVEAVHEEPGREWTVGQMASVAALSRSVFAERFHAAVGRSPASFVTEVRIESAKGMLDAGASVSETSRNLGYGSDEGFSRAFRRATGQTPSAWRTARRGDLVPA